MAIKDNKLKDLTPLNVDFLPGESPTSEKLEGMMNQVQVGLEYLENAFGDAFGEEEKFNTWMSTLARDIGDRSEINPLIVPNQTIQNYSQNLIAGLVEHELDLLPVGDLSTLILTSLDSCVVPNQYKSSPALLERPGDWTIGNGTMVNGTQIRARKLVTHSPSQGGSIIFNEVTSGKGSATFSSLENVIPNIAQAKDNGPFLDITVADAITNTYLVTLPLRTKMFDQAGEIVDFSASNRAPGVGLNSQYELPPYFFGNDGFALDQDDPEEGFGKVIPLNLIKIYDWSSKKQIDGIIKIKASPVPEARKYQFLLQLKIDVILNSAAQYVLVVPGNTITNQLKGLADSLFNNTGDGASMARLFEHKSLIGLRTSTTDSSNRSKYYGTSNIDANDHSQYLHRDGFTDTDKGAGGNVLRGDLLIGSKLLGPSDLQHEHYNLLDDSFKVRFGDNFAGGSLGYDKVFTHLIDHSYGGLPLSWSDNALLLEGSISDADPTKKNVVIDGDLRTTGNVILGKLASDVIFMQGRVVVNDELTLAPHTKAGITGEAGKIIYDPNEKALLVHNGVNWSSPANQAGYTVVIGDGIKTFGKYNGQNIVPFQDAVADVIAQGGGIIKVLDGTYNFLTNKLTISSPDIAIEGSSPLTYIKGTLTPIEFVGNNLSLSHVVLEGTMIGIDVSGSYCQIHNVQFKNCDIPAQFGADAMGSCLGSGVTYVNCAKSAQTVPGSKAKELVRFSAGFFPPHGNGLFDWSHKEGIVREMQASGGAGMTFVPTAESAVGAGSFAITGTGYIRSNKFLPISPYLGLGGHICINTTTTATVSVGVDIYDGSYNLIGNNYFIANGQVLNTNPLVGNFYKGMMVNGVSGVAQFPAAARFVKPVIFIANNAGTIKWDLFDIITLNYARASVWA